MCTLTQQQAVTDVRRALEDWRDYLTKVNEGTPVTFSSAALADLRVTVARALEVLP
jgi:hypothetical protein